MHILADGKGTLVQPPGLIVLALQCEENEVESGYEEEHIQNIEDLQHLQQWMSPNVGRLWPAL